MIDAVDTYLLAVRTDLARLPGSVLLVEQKVKPLDERDDIYGTADAIVWQPFGEVIIHDFKYGAGVTIEHIENDQARTYGLGALRAIGGPEDAETVTMVITQPRARHSDGPVRSEQIDARELWAWRQELLADAACTDDPKAPLIPGDWCRSTFCPLAGVCPAIRERALAAAQVDFDDLPENPAEHARTLVSKIDTEKLGKMLATVPILKALISEVEGLALRTLGRGEEVPGYKLVRKRANRHWRDEKALRDEIEAEILLGVIARDEAFKIELRSPAQLEKKLGKSWAETRWVKPEGGVTIAPDSDPRPGVTSIPAEFTIVTEEEE